MIVVCPHTDLLRPQTVEALVKITNDLPAPVSFRPMDDAHSYWALFHQLWHGREAFLIVEHDVVPTVEQVRELVRCDRPFCGFPYAHAGGRTLALGCTKFGAPLFDLPLDIPAWWAGARPPRWTEVDGWLASILPPVHAHPGEVRHLGVKYGAEVP